MLNEAGLTVLGEVRPTRIAPNAAGIDRGLTVCGEPFAPLLDESELHAAICPLAIAVTTRPGAGNKVWITHRSLLITTARPKVRAHLEALHDLLEASIARAGG